MGAPWKFLVFGFLLTSIAQAEVRFTILQTSDLHSHFLNRDNQFGLGGFARVATKVNQLRSMYRNTLFVDAGDWSEGSMFFTLDSGETTQRLLEALNYDAMVLGNHDWLIGPTEMYKVFEQVQMKVPILSANLNTKKTRPAFNMRKYIKPYIVREFDGIRIGILGLSTFEFIYDNYFKPVKIKDPITTAREFVKKLKEKEKCDVIIAVSHMGLDADIKLLKAVSGIDYIAGGHSHILLKSPKFVENPRRQKIPVTHVGKWGQYVGQTDLVFHNGYTYFEGYQLHQIDRSVEEDPFVKNMVDGAVVRLEKQYSGPVFNDRVMCSEVDLPIRNYASESTLGNWILDAMREYTDAELAIDSPNFSARDIFRGPSSSYDIFNVYPHIYSPVTQKTWTIKTFDINGFTLKTLLSLIYRVGFKLRISNAQATLDMNALINRLRSLRIDGKRVNYFKSYNIAATDGIFEAINFLQSYGIYLGVRNKKETGVEAWRVLKDYLAARSPVTLDKVAWQGRVRTIQPDLTVRAEELMADRNGDTLNVHFDVRNAGLTQSESSIVKLEFTDNYMGGDNKLKSVPGGLPYLAEVPPLAPGQSVRINLPLDITHLFADTYPIKVSVNPVKKEKELENNHFDSSVTIPYMNGPTPISCY